MICFVLTMLGSILPIEPEAACALTTNSQLLAAPGTNSDVLETVYASRWAKSTDGGAHWRVDTDHCIWDALYFWRLPVDLGQSCMAVSVNEHNRNIIEHRCTENEGATWDVRMVDYAEQGRLLDVTADPLEPHRMIAVQTLQNGTTSFAALAESDDGGRNWELLWPAGTLQIVGMLDEKLALVLKGPTFEAYTELWLVPTGHRRERELDGPWKGHATAQLTQAAVNPSNPSQLLVNVWLPQEHRETTWISNDRGRNFAAIRVPTNVVWPLEFAGADGALLANLRSDLSPENETQAHVALYDPGSQQWNTLELPPYASEAIARGGAIFATGIGLYRLQKMIGDRPLWQELRVQ